jgi:hypothetical protein
VTIRVGMKKKKKKKKRKENACFVRGGELLVAKRSG